jgi:hypothetical protein
MKDEHWLKTYRRTNKYHIVNGTYIVIMDELVIYIYGSENGYDIEFIHESEVKRTRFVHRMSSILRHLSIDTVWNVIKPYGKIHTNYKLIRNVLFNKREYMFSNITSTEKKTLNMYADKLEAYINDKLSANETAFKQELLSESKLTDCKIDFFKCNYTDG